MRYDISDRERLTRRSDCAFWLHLLAAPLVVHSLISLVTPNFVQFSNAAAVAIVLIVAVLAVIAIAIDRRALLVSALMYVGIVIAYAIGGLELWNGHAAQADRGLVFFATLVILGAFVITLGIGWLPLRRGLIRHISPSIAGRLAPLPNRA
jgi:cation transport ATPase